MKTNLLFQTNILMILLGLGIILTPSIAPGQDDRFMGVGEKGGQVITEFGSFLKPTMPPTSIRTPFSSSRGENPHMTGDRFMGIGEKEGEQVPEMGSFLKPKSATPSEAIKTKELSLPQVIYQIPNNREKGPTYFQDGADKWPWLNTR